MFSLVKTESHQVDFTFQTELTVELLAEIYPDLSADELAHRIGLIEAGTWPIDTLVSDAEHQGVEIEWDEVGQDNWTARKGGFDVAYSLNRK